METNTIFIASPKNEEQLSALRAFLKALKIKFEVREKDELYNTEFIDMVLNSEKEIKEGKKKKLTSNEFDNLWK